MYTVMLQVRCSHVHRSVLISQEQIFLFVEVHIYVV
jgi:hypothetical protein